jgi:tRNA pseudouridine synthase 10
LAHSVKFALCDVCAERQGDRTQFGRAKSADCFICSGLTSRFMEIGGRVARTLTGYQFKSFSIGLIVPSGVQEREDQLRSDLKVRGREAIKAQLGRSIIDYVRRKTGRKVDRLHPDITVLVDLVRDTLAVTAKSVFVSGRYTKPSGVPQKRELCERCKGRGCEECEAGYKKGISVEKVLETRIGRILRSPRAKLTWLGSEDPESIVFPPGRPFVAEFKAPKRRSVPSHLSARTGKGSLKVTGLRVLKGRPISVPSFVFKTRAIIEAEGQIGGPLGGTARKMRGTMIQFRNSKGKIVEKKVYSVRLGRRPKGLVAEIKLDGGLPVKRLVSGGSVSLSLAELLKTPLTCQRFDILRVWESGSFEFGKI